MISRYEGGSKIVQRIPEKIHPILGGQPSPCAFSLFSFHELLVHAFRKKTPLSFRIPSGGGAKGGTENVRRNVTFNF